jgi:beta-glucosidase
LGANYDKTIVVLNIGGVMDMTAINSISGINAVLLMTQLGNLGGDALVDVITGKVTPCGKTTDTWAKDYMDYPSSAQFSHNGSVHDEEYTDGIFMGYRYFDSFMVEPEYCFGYGKSYTDFAISTDSVSLKGCQVELKVAVQNIGKMYGGKEVVQVYYSAPDGVLAKPYQELIAFKKTDFLVPRETEDIAITFDIKDMASYSEKEAAWILEKGDYIIRVGNSSENTAPVAVITIEEDKKTQIGKNLFKLDCQLEEIEPDKNALSAKKASGVSEDIVRLNVKLSDIDTVQIKYQEERQPYTTDKDKTLTIQDVKSGNCTVEELVAQLTVDEMAQLCVGTLRADGGSIVGNASSLVPGAAGDTSSVVMESRGVKNMILADGPAGLRLQPHFKTTKDGTLIKGGSILGDVIEPFETDLKDDEIDDYYQYCTAIPIGWALAQSWNEELVAQAGDMVGSEMEQFNVDLWLAPAMNIHRNPLCGRNFEYYSEDPLIAGKIAAAMTKGVQKHSGKGTTIKHFAVNNQEDNRYFVNAHVSERALREIYLKGFEITVKESQPLSIMTSYNLLNGIHTANNHDLLQGMARDEWGFKGTVMTDWFTSQHMDILTNKFEAKYQISASTGCIYAGNDIQMPGCQKNVDDIVEAVNTGKEIDGYTITLADLQYNAANVIRVVAKTV